MRYLWMFPFLLVALLIPAVVLAGSGDGFDGVVGAIENQYHVRATRIPFMSLVSLISRRATHGGVSGLHVAEFDSFSEPVNGEELERTVEQNLGAGWERVIRETSHRSGAQTLIFMRPEDARMGLFIVDLSGREMDVVELSVDPNHLNDSIGRYEHSRPRSD